MANNHSFHRQMVVHFDDRWLFIIMVGEDFYDLTSLFNNLLGILNNRFDTNIVLAADKFLSFQHSTLLGLF